MKLTNLIFISVFLATSLQLFAQDLDKNEVYYHLELIPVSTQEDTSNSYQVMVVIDTSDLDLYKTITVESSVKSKDLKVSKEDRKDNPRIKLKKRNYHLDMQEWSENEELIIKAKMLDGTKVKLKKHPRGSEFSHWVITERKKRRDVKRFEGPGIVEDEKEKEKE